MCIPCEASFHNECEEIQDNGKCCCPEFTPFLESKPNKRGGQHKVDEDVTDPKSTGRKRAAVLFPLDLGSVCEWQGLKFAGGGFRPIVGCVNNTQTNRHHGPDKDTLNNEEGNVHRICPFCHNRWHAANDPYYEQLHKSDAWLSHDPNTKATSEEQVENEVYWASLKTKKVEDE